MPTEIEEGCMAIVIRSTSGFAEENMGKQTIVGRRIGRMPAQNPWNLKLRPSVNDLWETEVLMHFKTKREKDPPASHVPFNRQRNLMRIDGYEPTKEDEELLEKDKPKEVVLAEDD